MIIRIGIALSLLTLSSFLPSQAPAGDMRLALVECETETPLPDPVITSLSPTSGPVGSTVTISGQELSTNVKVGGVPAEVASFTPESVTVIVPTGATTGKITMTRLGGPCTEPGFGVSTEIFTVTSTPPPGGSSSPSGPPGKIQRDININPCCAIAPNPKMKGRLGRLVIAYPDGAKASGTRVDVYKMGETKPLAGDFGNYTLELFPGSYEVVISGKRVGGVTITSAHDTKVKIGVLRITVSKDTRVQLIDPTTGKALVGDFGSRDYGLPIGPVSVQVAGQTETVTIKAGQITDF